MQCHYNFTIEWYHTLSKVSIFSYFPILSGNNYGCVQIVNDCEIDLGANIMNWRCMVLFFINCVDVLMLPLADKIVS